MYLYTPVCPYCTARVWFTIPFASMHWTYWSSWNLAKVQNQSAAGQLVLQTTMFKCLDRMECEKRDFSLVLPDMPSPTKLKWPKLAEWCSFPAFASSLKHQGLEHEKSARNPDVWLLASAVKVPKRSWKVSCCWMFTYWTTGFTFGYSYLGLNLNLWLNASNHQPQTSCWLNKFWTMPPSTISGIWQQPSRTFWKAYAVCAPSPSNKI